jgi:hypothetical protein
MIAPFPQAAYHSPKQSQEYRLKIVDQSVKFVAYGLRQPDVLTSGGLRHDARIEGARLQDSEHLLTLTDVHLYTANIRV